MLIQKASMIIKLEFGDRRKHSLGFMLTSPRKRSGQQTAFCLSSGLNPISF